MSSSVVYDAVLTLPDQLPDSLEGSDTSPVASLEAGKSHAERSGAANTTSFHPVVLQKIPIWKRPFDLFLLLLTLPLTALVGAACALLIKTVSKGPLFFVQERVGYGGRRFACFKFRTMRANACTGSHQEYFRNLQQGNAPMRKLDASDSRILPGAKVIRALGLDELPQLINILRGDMSFVGPRPCTPFELQQYQTHQMERFSILPGLTGLWQVRGKNRTTFARMIELDIEYARTQSIISDIKILALTPITLAVQLSEAIASRRVAAAARSAQSTDSVEVQGASSVPTDA